MHGSPVQRAEEQADARVKRVSQERDMCRVLPRRPLPGHGRVRPRAGRQGVGPTGLNNKKSSYVTYINNKVNVLLLLCFFMTKKSLISWLKPLSFEETDSTLV